MIINNRVIDLTYANFSCLRVFFVSSKVLGKVLNHQAFGFFLHKRGDEKTGLVQARIAIELWKKG